MACLGGVTTTLNPIYDSIQDLERRLSITQAKYLVTIPSLALQGFSSGALKGIRSVFVIGEAQGCESISALLSDDGAAFPKMVKINPKEDVVALLSSSGTTGIPKVAMITHYNLIAEICLVFMKHGPLLEDMGRVLSVKSFCHIYGFAVTLGGRLYVGTKLVVLEHGFEPHAFLQVIQDYQVCFPILKYQVASSGRGKFFLLMFIQYQSCKLCILPATVMVHMILWLESQVIDYRPKRRCFSRPFMC